MHLVATRRAASRRRCSLLVMAAVLAALALLTAVSTASAASNVAKAWGRNQEGQLGNGTTSGPEMCGSSLEGCSTTPVAVGSLSGVKAVSAGGNHGLALLENGTVMAWGDNERGQLGNGTTTSSDVPVAVSGLSGVTAISAGFSQSLALLSDGTVMAWGEDPGNGTTKSDVPVSVSGLSGVVAIAAGGGANPNFNLALLSDGTVMAWGNDAKGQLGNGKMEFTPTLEPVPVSGLSGVSAISAGEEHGLALLNDGTVMAWGSNEEGQLGDGSTTSSDVPVAVSGLSGVSAISAGGYHSLALLSGGTVAAWGDNSHGELGDGTSTGPEACGLVNHCSTTPVAVGGLSGVVALDGGVEHSLALLANGTVKAWGRNDFGQLGDGTSTGPEACGTTACATTPVEVSKLSGAAGVSAGLRFSLAFGPPPPPATSLPEVGRCVKVATGTGIYKGAQCLTLETGNKGKYNWVPVSATEKQTFSGAGLETVLTSEGHPTIKCVATNITGEWRGPKTATVQLELQACTSPTGQQCSSTSNPQNKSEIKLTPLEAELGFIKNEVKEGKPIVVTGLDLKPQPPLRELASYECEGSGLTAHLEGSVIARFGPIDKMTTESNSVFYATKAGQQVPEKFEGGVKDTLIASFTAGIESKGSAPSTLTIKEEKGKYAAPLEIKAKV
jgi:alpha-tubulin suppressor-like RCC1 family protein